MHVSSAAYVPPLVSPTNTCSNPEESRALLPLVRRYSLNQRSYSCSLNCLSLDGDFPWETRYLCTCCITRVAHMALMKRWFSATSSAVTVSFSPVQWRRQKQWRKEKGTEEASESSAQAGVKWRRQPITHLCWFLWQSNTDHNRRVHQSHYPNSNPQCNHLMLQEVAVWPARPSLHHSFAEW